MLQAIESLTDEVRDGFAKMNGRVLEHDRDIVRIKTLWSVGVVVGAWVFSKLGDSLMAWVLR